MSKKKKGAYLEDTKASFGSSCVVVTENCESSHATLTRSTSLSLFTEGISAFASKFSKKNASPKKGSPESPRKGRKPSLIRAVTPPPMRQIDPPPFSPPPNPSSSPTKRKLSQTKSHSLLAKTLSPFSTHQFNSSLPDPSARTHSYSSSSSSSSSSDSSSESSSTSDSDSDVDVGDPLETGGERIRSSLPNYASNENKKPAIDTSCVTLGGDSKLIKFSCVSNLMDTIVILASSPDTPALDAETYVFTSDRKCIGVVFETFGPVKQPFYSIMFDSPEELKATGIKIGQSLFFSPNDNNLTQFVFLKDCKKGSDASWIGDKEPPVEALEYSDDETEHSERAERRASGNGRQGAKEKVDMGIAPQPTGIAPQPPGIPHQHTGILPQPTGIPHQHTGILTQPTGIPPQHTGILPQPTGIPHQHTGILTQPTGIPHQYTGVLPQHGIPSQRTVIPPEYTGIPHQHTGVLPHHNDVPLQHTGIPPPHTIIPPHVGIPVQHTGMPPQHIGIPPQNAAIPFQHYSIPPQHPAIPIQHPDLPYQQASNPSQYTGIPPQHIGTSSQNTGMQPLNNYPPPNATGPYDPYHYQSIQDNQLDAIFANPNFQTSPVRKGNTQFSGYFKYGTSGDEAAELSSSLAEKLTDPHSAEVSSGPLPPSAISNQSERREGTSAPQHGEEQTPVIPFHASDHTYPATPQT